MIVLRFHNLFIYRKQGQLHEVRSNAPDPVDDLPCNHPSRSSAACPSAPYHAPLSILGPETSYTWYEHMCRHTYNWIIREIGNWWRSIDALRQTSSEQLQARDAQMRSERPMRPKPRGGKFLISPLRLSSGTAFEPNIAHVSVLSLGIPNWNDKIIPCQYICPGKHFTAAKPFGCCIFLDCYY